MKHIPKEELLYAAEILQLLADKTRLAILAILSDQEMKVTAIAEALDRPLPGISQHLAKLRSAGLVTVRREGTSAYYSQQDVHLSKLVMNALQLADHALNANPRHHRN